MLFTLGILLHSRVISLNTGKCECVQEISSADMKRGYVYTPSHFRTYFRCPTRYNTLLKIEDMQKVRAFTLSILLLSRWRQTENMTKVGRKKFEDMNRNTELRTLESGCTCVCVCWVSRLTFVYSFDRRKADFSDAMKLVFCIPFVSLHT